MKTPPTYQQGQMQCIQTSKLALLEAMDVAQVSLLM